MWVIMLLESLVCNPIWTLILLVYCPLELIRFFQAYTREAWRKTNLIRDAWQPGLPELQRRTHDHMALWETNYLRERHLIADTGDR